MEAISVGLKLNGVNNAKEKNINFTFMQNQPLNEVIDPISKDISPEIETTVALDIERKFKQYTVSDTRKWDIIEGYSALHLNLQTRQIECSFCYEMQQDNIIPFIIMFIRPLKRMLQSFGYLFVHGACLRVFGKNILIVGRSGTGKSTAACALIKNGHSALSDETIFLKADDDRFSAYAITNWIKLSQHAKQNIFGEQTLGRMISEDEYIIKLKDINKNELKTAKSIDRIFILEQTGKEKTAVIDATATQVVAELLPVALDCSDRKQSELAFECFMNMLEVVPCSKVFFGTDMDDFSENIENMFRI